MEQIGDEEPEEEDVVLFDGDELPMPNFLTDEDEARLNATYTKMREEGLKQLMEDYEKGDYTIVYTSNNINSYNRMLF